MKTIGIDKSFCNKYYFEQKCLNNIKKIYHHVVKCDDQQKLKAILDATMVLTPQQVKYDIPSLPMTSKPVKKPSARKSLCLFTNILNVKEKRAKRRVGAAEQKRSATKVGNSLWTNKKKRKGH